MNKTVYLIGYMGVGKTTIGRKLARRLAYEFVDTDLWLEERFRQSVSEMFASVGEDNFRLRERSALEQLAGMQSTVIATGGGLPCHYDNIELMRQTGVVVYLEASDELLAQRLELIKQTRPTIRNKSGEELLAHVATAMSKRRPIYEQAHLLYAVEGIEVIANEDELVDRMVIELSDRLK